jgi:hypothetical protein
MYIIFNAMDSERIERVLACAPKPKPHRRTISVLELGRGV